MNKIIKCLFIITFSFIYSQQGMFVNDNKNHIAVSGSYETETDANQKTTSMGGSASYILNSGLEIIVLYQKATFDATELPDEYDFGANVIGGGGYYYIKNIAPVNFILGANYQMLTVVDYELLEDIDGEMTATNLSYGAGAYKTVAKGTGWELTPYVGYQIGNVEFKATAPGLPDLDNEDLGIDGEISALTIGLGIKFGQLTISPYVTSSEGNNDFNVTFGFIL